MLTAVGNAAQDDKSRPRKETSGGAKHEIKTAQTLIFVNTRIEDRPRFDALIEKASPSRLTRYPGVDGRVDRNITELMQFGTGEDSIKKIGHNTLVIVSNFRDATVQSPGEEYEESMKNWVKTFTSAKKHKAIKLVLLSTDKKPSDDLIKLTELSGGSYRKLTVGANGSYE
jgi:hypothetical protein